MSSDEEIRRAQGARLRQVRLSAGFPSARAAALTADWPESTYRAHEGGARTIDPKDADRYVKYFNAHSSSPKKYTGRWIIYGDEDELAGASFDELLAGESPNFRRRAYQAILALKKR